MRLTSFARGSDFVLDNIALTAVLLTPLALLHAHGIADALIAIADVCFLARSNIASDWTWLREPWVRVALVWWGWLVVCSIPFPALHLGEGGSGSFIQAVATVRFLIFPIALQHAFLREASSRRWMFAIIAASAIYIAAQSLIQFAFGHNLYGAPRGRDGELTGPFSKPRAGPPLSRVLLPVLLPPAVALLARPGFAAKLGAYALLLAGMCMMVLVGQRMPLMLTGLGMLVAALLLPQLRRAVVLTGVVGLVLVAATVVVSPPTYHRLVLKFSYQMDNFATSQYGQLYARALEIGEQHPFTGRGFDGFRTGCPLPRYFRPSFDGSQPHGGGASICAAHPHNFYFQALDEGGVPGLVLFCVLASAWLAPLARGLWREPDPLRVGLFAAAFIQLWPIASTSAFTSMPMGGWFFLLLGWGFAEAHARGLTRA